MNVYAKTQYIDDHWHTWDPSELEETAEEWPLVEIAVLFENDITVTSTLEAKQWHEVNAEVAGKPMLWRFTPNQVYPSGTPEEELAKAIDRLWQVACPFEAKPELAIGVVTDITSRLQNALNTGNLRCHAPSEYGDPIAWYFVPNQLEPNSCAAEQELCLELDALQQVIKDIRSEGQELNSVYNKEKILHRAKDILRYSIKL